MKSNHFENLWEEVENFYLKSNEIEDIEDIEDITNKLHLKISLYKTLSYNNSFSKEEKISLLNHTFGEILFELCKISAKDNVNVYSSLQNILNHKIVDNFQNK